jgi:hypothetical protein
MSIGLSNAFVTLFDAEVKQAYQGKAMLVGAVRQRRGVEGSTVKFPKVGRGVATPRVGQTDVTPLNVGFSNVTLTLADWIAAEYSDIFSQAKVNFDERSELVQVLGNAIGRRQDQLILDALAASGTSLSVGNDVGGSDTNMNVAKLRQAKGLMDKNNVPPTDRGIIIHSNGLQSLLAETAVTSSDFNTVKALVNGELDTFLGFKFHVIGDRTEGGLAIDGSLDIHVLRSTKMLSATAKVLLQKQKSITSQKKHLSWLHLCSLLAQLLSTQKVLCLLLLVNLKEINNGIFINRFFNRSSI